MAYLKTGDPVFQEIDDDRFLFEGKEISYSKKSHDPEVVGTLLDLILTVQSMLYQLHDKNLFNDEEFERTNSLLKEGIKGAKTIVGPSPKRPQ